MAEMLDVGLTASINGELREGVSGLRLLFTSPILFLEPFDPSGSIQKLLLSRKKGMAVGTDLNPDFFLSAFRLESRATGASDHGIVKTRVDIFLHKSLHLVFYHFPINFQPLGCLSAHRACLAEPMRTQIPH